MQWPTGNPKTYIQKLMAIILFYWIMATAYYFTILFNVQSFIQPGSSFWEGESYLRILLDYSLKLLFTIPVWLLIFLILKHVALWKQLLVHFITLPLFVYMWKFSFYYLCELMGYGHLEGDGEVWDLYIPSLFYMLQFALFHVYHYYQQLQVQQKLSAELQQLTYKSEVSTLKAQIQPHFLFNTLNSISAGLPLEEEQTRMSIARLADTFRYAMNTARKEHVPFREELHFIQNYLALEQERFSDRLQIIYNIDPRSLPVGVPPFLLQPLIENALFHGIGKSKEGGVIQINVQVMDCKIHFEVLDTGAGLNGYPTQELLQKGIGLQNTSLRLEKLFGEKITINNNQPKGTKISFSIPLMNIYDYNKSGHY